MSEHELCIKELRDLNQQITLLKDSYADQYVIIENLQSRIKLLEQEKVIRHMTYLQGQYDQPDTWRFVDDPSPYGALGEFKSKEEARLWVIKTLSLRVKEINRVKHAWMHPKDKT